jgi:hypothetical protein
VSYEEVVEESESRAICVGKLEVCGRLEVASED